MKAYTIHWKSTVNGRIGAGTFLFDKEEAESLADELNRSYPGICHEAVLSLPLPIGSAVVQPAHAGGRPLV
ncbi:MAG: hypothetical protein ABSA69_09570 [Verrucomicrobiota bacterium]